MDAAVGEFKLPLRGDESMVVTENSTDTLSFDGLS
jgi:hypothetical protein